MALGGSAHSRYNRNAIMVKESLFAKSLVFSFVDAGTNGTLPASSSSRKLGMLVIYVHLTSTHPKNVPDTYSSYYLRHGPRKPALLVFSLCIHP